MTDGESVWNWLWVCLKAVKKTFILNQFAFMFCVCLFVYAFVCARCICIGVRGIWMGTRMTRDSFFFADPHVLSHWLLTHLNACFQIEMCACIVHKLPRVLSNCAFPSKFCDFRLSIYSVALDSLHPSAMPPSSPCSAFSLHKHTGRNTLLDCLRVKLNLVEN